MIALERISQTNRCTGASFYERGSNVNALVFISSGWTSLPDHESRAYALTQVWHNGSTGEILDVDIEMNEERGPFTVCPDAGCPAGVVDLQNVLTHEFGHYFGMSHSPDDRLATMYAEAASEEVIKRDLRPDDVLGICSIYAPGVVPSTCDATPRGGLNLDCNGGCGCRISRREPALFSAVLSLLVLGLWFFRRQHA